MTLTLARETRSTCPYCGVGCGVIIQSEGSQITGVRGDPDHPANRGRLCTKGTSLHLTATPAVLGGHRLLHPQLRATRQAPMADADWDTVTQHVAQRLSDTVQQHGPDALGFYVSGQLLTEDYYVFNKLAKGLVGTNNIDSNSRLCMSSAVVGYKQGLGADAQPTCYDDLNHAHCVFIAGSNTAWAHPVLYRRLEDARRANPAMRVIVVDPRRTETADDADLHLAIQPGTDVALFHGMLHAMIWEGWLNQAFIDTHTDGFDALKALVRDMTPPLAAQRCGIKVDDLLQAARWFATMPATLSLYCQGLNQSTSGTAKNTALINLHLATGQIGRPGAGPMSLTGQPNAMGGREVGAMATLMSGHRDLDNPQHRADVAALWGVPDVPAKPGKAAVAMFEAAARGEIKALWIACTNPVQSMPDQALVRRALERCEFVVLQEAFADTATSAYADVLLPASTWGEKDGSVTNSERCISRVRAAVPAPGNARHDWRIVRDIARAMQTRLAPERPDHFPYDDAGAIWREHQTTTAGRDLDITGLTDAMLDTQGPQAWPVPSGAKQGQARLYQDLRFATPNARARFIAKPYKAPAEARDANHPFALTTTRLRDQWHGMSRSGTVPKLHAQEPRPVLRMNPHDLPRRGLQPGDLVKVISKRGDTVVPLQACDRVASGQADLAMHGANVNRLTTSAACPDSQQPELKHAAVRVEPAKLPWRLTLALWLDDAHRHASLQRAWQAATADLPYSVCAPVAGQAGRIGLRLDAANDTPLTDALVQGLAASAGLLSADVGRYVDAHRSRTRLLAFAPSAADPAAGPTLRALLVCGEVGHGAWLLDLWRDEALVAAYGRSLLAPDAAMPGNVTPRSPQVCNCLDVSEHAIRQLLPNLQGDSATRVIALQQQLACGTQCGSCLPTLRRLVQTVPAAAGAATASTAAVAADASCSPPTPAPSAVAASA
jgi:assimilatory nitrate reductase catalytic subunit